MAKRGTLRNRPSAPADDNGQFTLEVEAVAGTRLDQRLPVADMAVRESCEDRGMRYIRASGFGLVLCVVQPDAENLSCIRYHGKERNVRRRQFGRPAGQVPGRRLEPVRLDKRPDRPDIRSQPAGQIDDAGFRDSSESDLSKPGEADQFHVYSIPMRCCTCRRTGQERRTAFPQRLRVRSSCGHSLAGRPMTTSSSAETSIQFPSGSLMNANRLLPGP